MSDLLTGKLLLLEDERNLGATLLERLEMEGFEVLWAQSCAEAHKIWESQPKVDLALLDVGLPDGSGFEVGAWMREKRPEVAVVFLTAFHTPEDRIRGLEMGAEDYVTKPFHLEELILRVKNAHRRAQALVRRMERGGASEGLGMTVGKAQIHFDRFEAQVGGRAVPLTHKECALLRVLVDAKGKVVSRDEILDRVWSEDEFPTSRTVDNFILKLRKLVETSPEDPQVIRSVRGVGYQLV